MMRKALRLFLSACWRALSRVAAAVRRYFSGQDPRFGVAFGAALIVALALFVRSPYTNYIFDEQEALLANPYVSSNNLKFTDVLKRDFWGLPPERSIGSYRPLPNVIWRLIWKRGNLHPVFEHPWTHHLVNIVVHAANAALVAAFARRVGARRATAWLAGAFFACCAILTEAVTGVVGLADVLGGLGLLLALHALAWPLWAMPLGVFAALLVGFFSKESTLVALPVLAWAALVTAPLLHPRRPRRVPRSLVALLAAVAALAVYTEVRRHFFPVAVPAELSVPLPADTSFVEKALHDFLRWFKQPKLPQDPINNPLVHADAAHRIAGALGVYAKGFAQLLFPWSLSGDYSYAAETVPERLVSAPSVAGALLLCALPLAGIALWFRSLFVGRRGSRAARADLVFVMLAFVWVPIAYFPHSNIVVLLPTVRAERFWYPPAIGAAFAVGVALSWLLRRWRAEGLPRLGALAIAALLGVHALKARQHSLDYTNDLLFWRATAKAVPESAKAHLNYGVMLGARRNLEGRLEENGRALEIAPKWPMAHVYYADVLCRLDRQDEAWPHYVRGFELAPNDRNLIALGLQCLWDKKSITKHRGELLRMATRRPGTWLAYLARDIVYNGQRHEGVDKQYRPRSYNERAKGS